MFIRLYFKLSFEMVLHLRQCENYNSKQKWSLPQYQNLDGKVAAYIKHAICKCNVHEYRQKSQVGNIK